MNLVNIFMNLYPEESQFHIPYDLIRYNILTFDLTKTKFVELNDLKESLIDYFGLYLQDRYKIEKKMKKINYESISYYEEIKGR